MRVLSSTKWLVLALPLLAACFKSEEDYSPFPDNLLCTFDNSGHAGYFLSFEDADIWTSGGYAPISFKKDRGWDVDIRILDATSGFARFDVDPRGKLNEGQETPRRFTVRKTGEAFSLEVDPPRDNSLTSPIPILPCSTYPESDNADP